MARASVALMPIPDAFAAAYFAACIVIGGALVCAALIVVAYLRNGGK